MRAPILRASFERDGLALAPDEIVVDNFAGGGGASTGVERALDGRPVDIAINHDPEAIAMHRANHPETRHYNENICEVDPREACAGRRVAFAWFSPDCTHFSRAKGTKPLRKDIRALANVVIDWAREARPRIIALENVEEFQTWGPLDEHGRPIKALAGEDFRAWLAKLVELGYQVETRCLVAADYGAPTTRRRFFLVARCDGRPIVWPEPTHGEGRAHPWRAAAEVIDWSIPCPSIFERRRPLAEATMQRIARGLQRFVLEEPDPFIIPLTHRGDQRVHSISDPVRTITAAHRGELALVSPFIVRHGHYSTRTGAGIREGCGAGTFRGQPLSKPLATVCATNDKHIVAAFVEKAYGGPNGHQTPGLDLRRPLGTVTAKDHSRLVAAFLTKYYGNAVAQAASDPLHTVTAKARFALVTIHGVPYAITDIGLRMLQPHELFAAHAFPADYEIAPMHNGKPLTKTAQTKLVGNSVPPPLAEHIARANLRCAA